MRSSLRGWLAQLVEHRPYKARVTGSIPVPPTKLEKFSGPVVQLVRMPACHAGGRGFESRPVRHYYPHLSWICGVFFGPNRFISLLHTRMRPLLLLNQLIKKVLEIIRADN